MPRLPTHELYAEQLFPLDLGYALYEPDPGDHDREVRIGDIGYIMNGGFERLASLFTPGNGVDVVVEEEYRRTRDYGNIPERVLSSKSVQSVSVQGEISTVASDPINMSFSFSRKCTSGASLVKKYRATDEKSLYPNILQERFEECVENVFDFAKRSNRPVTNLHDIILISGRIMTGDWATAAFQNRTQNMNMAFHIQTPVAGAGFSLWGYWSTEVTFPTKVGPQRNENALTAGPEPAFNQCIFIHTYRMASRSWFERLTGSSKMRLRLANKGSSTQGLGDAKGEEGKETEDNDINNGNLSTGTNNPGEGDVDDNADSDDLVLTAYEVLAFNAFLASSDKLDSICIDDEDVKRLLPASCTLDSIPDTIQGVLELSVVEREQDKTRRVKIGKLLHDSDFWKAHELSKSRISDGEEYLMNKFDGPSPVDNETLLRKGRIAHLLAGLRATNLSEDLFDMNTQCVLGSHVDVYQARSRRHNGLLVAVKRIHLFLEKEEHLVTRFCRMLNIWSDLNHPNVFPLLGYELMDKLAMPALVSKWMSKGSAQHYLQENSNVSIRHLAKGIAAGLEFLHNQNILVENLRCDNILISDEEEPMITNSISIVLRQASNFCSINSNHDSGNVRWCAIDLFEGENRPTKETDIWAFGMVVYELLTKEVPFHHLTSLVAVILAIVQYRLPNKPTPLDGHDEQLLWTIGQRCWSKDPQDRPNIAWINEQLS